MIWRGWARRLLPYVIAATAGFLIAYLIVAFFVFPAGIVPNDELVPNVVGMTYEDAAARLERSGFESKRGQSRFHTTVPQGSVLSQDPPSGGRELRGTTVTLEVSGGQRFVVVPTLTGLTRRDAEVALDVAGLEVGDIIEREGAAPRGEVIETSPAPGARVTVPSRVSLVLSAGPEAIQMPDVVGSSLADARLTIQQLGLRLRSIDYDPSSSSPDGTVISQTPAAGERAAAGTTISLRVAGRIP